jgi:hypothetical protein
MTSLSDEFIPNTVVTELVFTGDTEFLQTRITKVGELTETFRSMRGVDILTEYYFGGIISNSMNPNTRQVLRMVISVNPTCKSGLAVVMQVSHMYVENVKLLFGKLFVLQRSYSGTYTKSEESKEDMKDSHDSPTGTHVL